MVFNLGSTGALGFQQTLKIWKSQPSKGISPIISYVGVSTQDVIHYNLFLNDFFFILAGVQCSVHFLLYSKATQSHMHIYILFSHMTVLHHK